MNGKELENFIKRAKKGDAHAFGIVCGGLSQDAYRFALFYMKNPHDAEDAVQDACLKAWQKLPDLKKTEAFRTWENPFLPEQRGYRGNPCLCCHIAVSFVCTSVDI